jgi:hypothetical protein
MSRREHFANTHNRVPYCAFRELWVSHARYCEFTHLAGLASFGRPSDRSRMPRYHFEITMPGEFIRDRDGQELPSLEAAQSQARSVAQRILKSHKQQSWAKAVFHIMCDGQEVATVPFSESTKPTS